MIWIVGLVTSLWLLGFAAYLRGVWRGVRRNVEAEAIAGYIYQRGKEGLDVPIGARFTTRDGKQWETVAPPVFDERRAQVTVEVKQSADE